MSITFKRTNILVLALMLCVLLSGCSTYSSLGEVKKQTLRCGTYQMSMPESAECTTSLSSDWYTFEKDGKNYGVIVSNNTNPDEVSDYFKLENIQAYYLYDRNQNLPNIIKDESFVSPEYSEAEEETVKSYKAYVSSGKIKNQKSDDEESTETDYNYVSFDFFADSESTTPMEIFVTSKDASQEKVRDIAEDILSSISSVD